MDRGDVFSFLAGDNKSSFWTLYGSLCSLPLSACLQKTEQVLQHSVKKSTEAIMHVRICSVSRVAA